MTPCRSPAWTAANPPSAPVGRACAPTKPTRSYRWPKTSQRLRRSQPFCTLCAATGALTVDHVVPLHRGGPEYDPANLRVLCASCHGKVWPAQR